MADGWLFNIGVGGLSAGTQDFSGFQYQQMLPYPPAGIIISNRINLVNTTETILIDKGGASVFRDLYWLYVSNQVSAKAVITISDANIGGATVLTILVPAERSFPIPIPSRLIQTTADRDWTAQLDVGSSNGLAITAIAIKRSTIET